MATRRKAGFGGRRPPNLTTYGPSLGRPSLRIFPVSPGLGHKPEVWVHGLEHYLGEKPPGVFGTINSRLGKHQPVPLQRWAANLSGRLRPWTEIFAVPAFNERVLVPLQPKLAGILLSSHERGTGKIDYDGLWHEAKGHVENQARPDWSGEEKQRLSQGAFALLARAAELREKIQEAHAEVTSDETLRGYRARLARKTIERKSGGKLMATPAWRNSNIAGAMFSDTHFLSAAILVQAALLDESDANGSHLGQARRAYGALKDAPDRSDAHWKAIASLGDLFEEAVLGSGIAHMLSHGITGAELLPEAAARLKKLGLAGALGKERQKA